MKVPETFTIHCTSKCLLRCNFCWLKYYKVPNDEMPLSYFEKCLKYLNSQNIKNLDLTPMVGEFFTLKDYREFLKLSELYFEKISLHTSLTPKVNYNLSEFKKLKIFISFYGNNEKEFKEKTNSNLFNIFLENLKNLKTFNKPSIILREKNISSSLIRNLIKIKNIEIVNTELQDRDLKFSEKKDFENGCRFLQEPVLHNKGISSCCMDFQKNKFIIGKLGDNLEKIYKNLEIKYCNKECKWFQKI